MLSALDWINLGYFLSSSYLLVVVFYYYNKTSIPDFAIFGGFYFWLGAYALSTLGHLFNENYAFFTSILAEPSSSFEINVLYTLSSWTGYFFYFMINLYFARGISNQNSLQFRKYNRYALMMNIFMYIPLLFGQTFYFPINFSLLIILRFGIFLTILSVQLAILFESIRQFRDQKKHHFYNKTVAKSWKIAIYLTIVSGFAFISKFVEMIISFVTGSQVVVLDIYYITAVGLGLLAINIIMVMSIMIPQSLLVFRYQIIRAVQYYPRSTSAKKEDPVSLSSESISEYLERLTEILDLDLKEVIVEND